MTQKVITVPADSPIQEAILLLSKYDFNGLPVVDKNKKLVGLFTEKNMLADGAYSHLRTLLKLFSEMNYYHKDHAQIKNQLKDIVKLKVTDVMNPHPVVKNENDSIDDARELFFSGAVVTLPILNADKKLVGILTARDFTKFYGNPLPRPVKEQDVNREIDHFVRDFENRFIIVSKTRVRIWLITNISFLVLGIAIAMFFILRVNLN